MTADEVKEMLDRLELSVKQAKSMPIEPGQWPMQDNGAVMFYTGECFFRIGDFHITDETKIPNSPLWLFNLHSELHRALYDAGKTQSQEIEKQP